MFVTFGETALRLSPPGAERIETAHEFTAHASGPESNAAVAATRVGIDAAWWSVLPDSPLGRRIESELMGYDLDVVTTHRAGRQTLTFFERGSPPRDDVALQDHEGGGIEHVEPDDLPLDDVGEAGAAYVASATASRSAAAAGVTARFLKAAAEGGATTALGLWYDETRWPTDEARDTLTGLFPAVDVLVSRESDLGVVLDRDGKPSEAVHSVASAHDFEVVALVRDQATLAWHDATLYEYPIPETDVVDPTGAEDAFAGAFMASLLDGDSVEEALRCATAALALTRTLEGPVPTLSKAELDALADDITAARPGR